MLSALISFVGIEPLTKISLDLSAASSSNKGVTL